MSVAQMWGGMKRNNHPRSLARAWLAYQAGELQNTHSWNYAERMRQRVYVLGIGYVLRYNADGRLSPLAARHSIFGR